MEGWALGLKSFLSSIMDDDSSHPGNSGVAGRPPAGDSPESVLGQVLQILVDSAPKEGEPARVGAKLEKICQRWSQERKHMADIPSLVESQRKAEREWVEETVRDMAQGVMDILRRLGKSAGDSRQEDRSMGAQLDRLREASKGESLELLRQQVIHAVESMAKDLSVREERQAKELAQITGQLENLKRELTRVRKEATLDGLTRLSNRPSLDEHLEAILSVHRITGRPCCLLMIDLDRFKDVNDSHGHLAGDEVLKMVSDCLVRSFPRKTDFLARYGGEEFCVVLSEDGVKTGQRLGERFLQALRGQTVSWEGKSLSITASMGLAGPEDAESVEAWVGLADRMLYRAKESGRDRLVCTGE